MTTAVAARRYRTHELAFDRSDAGHVASCSCGSAMASEVHVEEDDAHYAGARHLGLMALAGLRARRELRGHRRVPTTLAIDDRALWSELARYRPALGDEAQAVLDVVAEHWPERAR
ncbi:MAG: hypothetical protein ACLGIO_04360 [Acidimicrobiia bacterium]